MVKGNCVKQERDKYDKEEGCSNCDSIILSSLFDPTLHNSPYAAYTCNAFIDSLWIGV